MSYDDSYYSDDTPKYSRNPLKQVWGFAVVGTYLFALGTLLVAGWVVRKLWHFDRDKGGKQHNDPPNQ